MNTNEAAGDSLANVDGARGFMGCLRHLRKNTGRRRFGDEQSSDTTAIIDNPFIVDKISLLNSKALRRLARKTQVTAFPRNPHIRDRRSHTDEVVASATNIAHILGLNIDLVEAIALGHDIGHVPFGHPGERYLAEKTGNNFTHEVMGVFIAQHIERRGRGLNLTYEVLEGMYRHSGANAILGMSQEAWLVRYADKFAYLFSDFNDFKRMDWPMRKELVELVHEFGTCQRERHRTIALGLIEESANEGKVSFEKSPVAKRFAELRTLMYEIYPKITLQKPEGILEPIFNHVLAADIGDPRIVIGLMTDTDVEFLSRQYALNHDHIRQTAVGELIPFIKDLRLDCCDPDLGW